MTQASENDFYRQLQPHASFAVVGDVDAFTPLPGSWRVVVADIRDSTRAIAAGRYKDVNLVGAGCIVAALNAVPELDLPYVFGGDGATLAVPPDAFDGVRTALLKTRSLAAETFGLELRVGAVSVATLRERGADVAVARFALSRGNDIALFSGGGVELADRLVKDDTDSGAGFAFGDAADADPDLTGLSCRWEPLRATRGNMVNLLIRARSTDTRAAAALYRSLIAAFDGVLGTDPLAGAPVRAENLRFRWPPRGLGAEASLTRGGKPRWRRFAEIWLESLVQFVLERFDASAGGYDAPVYREEMRTNTDFRRFDGMLRMVVDCSDAELAEIRATLVARHDAGELDYGMHVADAALMTCVVFDLSASRHLHFVDGADGGFAMAALELKAQLARYAQSLASTAGSA